MKKLLYSLKLITHKIRQSLVHSSTFRTFRTGALVVDRDTDFSFLDEVCI